MYFNASDYTMLAKAVLKSWWSEIVAVSAGRWFHSCDVRGMNDWEKELVLQDGKPTLWT